MKRMTKKQLDVILEQHALWLKSDGINGKQGFIKERSLPNADFKHRDLRYLFFNSCHLPNIDCRGANLNPSKFIKCDLRQGFFQNSNASDCDFSGSDLYYSYFQGTILPRANFSKSTLLSAIFYQANIQDAIFAQATVGQKRMEIKLEKDGLEGLGDYYRRKVLKGAITDKEETRDAND